MPDKIIYIAQNMEKETDRFVINSANFSHLDVSTSLFHACVHIIGSQTPDEHIQYTHQVDEKNMASYIWKLTTCYSKGYIYNSSTVHKKLAYKIMAVRTNYEDDCQEVSRNECQNVCQKEPIVTDNFQLVPSINTNFKDILDPIIKSQLIEEIEERFKISGFGLKPFNRQDKF